MSTWTVEATARTAGRPDAGTIGELSCRGMVSRYEVHGCGSHGVSVRLTVEADTVAVAYAAALAFLASRLLPLLDGAHLTDLRVLASAPPASSPAAPSPSSPGTPAPGTPEPRAELTRPR